MISTAIILSPGFRVAAITAPSGLNGEVKRDVVPLVFRTIEAARAQNTAVVQCTIPDKKTSTGLA